MFTDTLFIKFVKRRNHRGSLLLMNHSLSLREECSFEHNENIYEPPSSNRVHSTRRRVESQGQLSCHHDAYNPYILIQCRSLPFERRELCLGPEGKVVVHSLRITESIPLRLPPLLFFLTGCYSHSRQSLNAPSNSREPDRSWIIEG